MPGSKAETVYGRQGGGWAPKATEPRKGHVVHVTCQGGPYAGKALAMHTFGEQPEPIPVVPVSACGGLYRLDRGTYRWELTR